MKRILGLGLLIVMAIGFIGCSKSAGSSSKSAEPKFAITSGVTDGTAKLDDSGYMNIKGTVSKGTKYVAVYLEDRVLDAIRVKNGKFTYHNNGSGGPFTLTLQASKSKIAIGDDATEISGPKIKVKVAAEDDADNDANSSEASSSSSTELDFGKSLPLGNQTGSIKADVTVISAQKVTDPSEGLTADLMANYPELKQFAIITYKVSATTDIPKDTFDGSNFTFLDADKTRGTVSSNRDPGSIGDLKAGESANYRIGVGFSSTEPTVYVRMGNVVWKGSIQ